MALEALCCNLDVVGGMGQMGRMGSYPLAVTTTRAPAVINGA